MEQGLWSSCKKLYAHDTEMDLRLGGQDLGDSFFLATISDIFFSSITDGVI